MKIKTLVSATIVPTEDNKKSSSKCPNCTKMCGYECGTCGRYDPNYKGGYCKWNERGNWPSDHSACEHYY